jgi:hypothetical protein
LEFEAPPLLRNLKKLDSGADYTPDNENRFGCRKVELKKSEAI